MGATSLRICRLYPSCGKLIGNPPKTEQWLDNEAVCKRLGISKRTLQSYRDTGKIPFSMIGHKCYYKQTDICEMLNAVKDWNQRMNELWQRMKSLRGKTLRCSCFTTDGRHFEEVGAVLLYRPSDAEWWGLPFGWGGLQPITAQHTHAPRVQKLRNASFLQNRREDTLQAERHTSHAWKTL